jgi:hypothetical protein
MHCSNGMKCAVTPPRQPKEQQHASSKDQPPDGFRRPLDHGKKDDCSSFDQLDDRSP